MPSLAPDGKKRRFKRRGPISTAEKELVAAVVMDNPGPLTSGQETSLAKALRRPKAAIQEIISQAKENFAANAERYTEIHLNATEAALASGTIGGLEVAQKGSQWAMEHISADGVRVIDKAAGESTGSRIMIGIQVGGVDQPNTVVALPKVVVAEKV